MLRTKAGRIATPDEVRQHEKARAAVAEQMDVVPDVCEPDHDDDGPDALTAAVQRMEAATLAQMREAVAAYQRGESVGVYTDVVRHYLRYQEATA
jgi:hypothetical protein